VAARGAGRGARRRAAAVVLALLAACATLARAQAVLDETVATVNGELIAKSDVLWNLALDRSVSPEDFWRTQAQRFMLETLIDQRLLLQEAAKLPATTVTDEEVERRIAELSSGFSSAEDPNRFVRRQALVGLTRGRLERIVRDRLRIEKFVDFRFRSFAVVTEPEISRYFDAEIRPKLEAQGLVVAEHEAAKLRPQIEAALVDRKVTAELDEYLAETRAKAEVVYVGAWAPPPAGAGVATDR
jgi:hypothetical protein